MRFWCIHGEAAFGQEVVLMAHLTSYFHREARAAFTQTEGKEELEEFRCKSANG